MTTVDVAPDTTYRSPGYSLPGRLYTSADAYDTDLAAVFGRVWLYVASDGRGARARRLRDGRHRPPLDRAGARRRLDGARVPQRLPAPRFSTARRSQRAASRNIVCPYHQWTYDTERQPAPCRIELRPTSTGADLPLRAVHVRSVGGLLFVCLADKPPADFDDFAATVTPYLAPARPRARQGRRPDRLDRGRQLEARDGEQPRMRTLRWPSRADEIVLPRLRLHRGRHQPAAAPALGTATTGCANEFRIAATRSGCRGRSSNASRPRRPHSASSASPSITPASRSRSTVCGRAAGC